VELTIRATKTVGSFNLDLDLAVSQDRVGVFGPSGSGKSTLAALVAGLQQPDSGAITLGGEPLFDSRAGICLPPEQRRIGIVFQHAHLFPHLNVRGNLLYGYTRCAVDQRRITLDDLVEVLQIGHLLDRGVNRLSGGEKQRIAIGRAVLSNPRLLIMDEPLSALDDRLRFQIIDYLKAACNAFHIPYLFISHSLLEMRLMADQAVSMADGRVTAQTDVESLARSRMGQSPAGYVNLLHLERPRRTDGMGVYRWGGRDLFVSEAHSEEKGIYELTSKEIILLKQHPEAISARNLLECMVVDTFVSGHKVGVELACGTGRLIAEIVPEAARELAVMPGSTLFAAIKASAFRRLG
jgi:molybdate transport system ATP-binding protein